MSLMGVDIGTSGCKAATMDDDGSILSYASREYVTMHPAVGEDELDSGFVWSLVEEVIAKAALGAKGTGRGVEAICFSSMGEAVVPVTKDRRILDTSILSSDIRGSEYVERLLARLTVDDIYRICPNIPGTNYTLPKLCWLRDNRPQIYSESDYFLLWGDLAGFMLGADAVSTYSLANRTLLFDFDGKCWSHELIAASDLDAAKLPRLCPSGSVIGTVSRSAADRLGLTPQTLIVSGGHDQSCNALGLGAVDQGQAVCGMGTYECITPVFSAIPDLKAMSGARLGVEHHVIKDRYVTFVYNQSGSLVRWFKEVFAGGDELSSGSVYESLMSEMPEKPTDLIVLPYFEMAGAPEFSPGRHGCIFGLSTHNDRGSILKAILEGATYYFAENIKSLARLGINLDALTVSGGGARSDAWLRIKSDILGLPVHRTQVQEAGILGASILAGCAIGVYSGYEEAARTLVRPADSYYPDESRNKQYGDKLHLYMRLKSLLVPDLDIGHTVRPLSKSGL